MKLDYCSVEELASAAKSCGKDHRPDRTGRTGRIYGIDSPGSIWKNVL